MYILIIRRICPAIRLDHERDPEGEYHFRPTQRRRQVCSPQCVLGNGADMDFSRMHEIIKACCLEHDLEMLPNGENTEIGEKGINLSGEAILGAPRLPISQCLF